MQIREIKCDICQKKVGECKQPDNYPEEKWELSLKGYVCEECQEKIEAPETITEVSPEIQAVIDKKMEEAKQEIQKIITE